MARGSFKEEDLYKPSQFEFIDKVGDKKRGEIVAAKSQYVQWQPKKGSTDQQAPLTSVVLSLVELGADGSHVGDPIDKELVVQWGPQDGSMIVVRPGNAPDRATDPEDTRDENGNLVLGTEGNTLFIDEGRQYSSNSPYINFVRSCKQAGFKPEVIDQAYLQDLVGLQADFELVPGKANRSGKTHNDFVVTSISKYPYEKAAKTASKPTASAAKQTPTPKVNGAAKPQATPAPASAPTADIDEDLSMEVVSILREVFPTITKPTSRTKIASSALMAAMKANPPKEPGSKEKIQGIDKILKNRNWFDENLVLLGGKNVGDDVYQSAE
jgi:hypothetical protein